MTVHFFTKSDDTKGGSRQRAFFVAAEMNRIGVNAIVHYPDTETLSLKPWPGKIRLIGKTLNNFLNIKRGDVVYLQRTVYNKYFFIICVSYLTLFRRKTFFDIDDAVYLHTPVKTKILAKISDFVIVGSHSLQSWAKNYNKAVELIPTGVSFEKYASAVREDDRSVETFCLGWVGNGPAHVDNLKLLVPVFKTLIDRQFKFHFILVGAMKSVALYNMLAEIPGLQYTIIDQIAWNIPSETAKIIATFDVGVMPLTDTKWNEGKCSFKAIEYMATGIPTIISDVGENSYLIQNGENGFLANNTEEWVQTILTIKNDPEEAKRISKNGQQTILQNYTITSAAKKIITLIDNIK